MRRSVWRRLQVEEHGIEQRPTARTVRLLVGIVDSFPKLITFEILKPAFALPAAHVVCREGKSDPLLAQLAVHRLDIVLADEPAASSVAFRAFNHRLGESGVTLCATPSLAARLRRGFPQSLHDAPALLPAENTALRRNLEAWFRVRHVTPRVIAEFDDLALMKAMAVQAPGFVPVPTVVLREATGRYGLRVIGEATGCRDEFYAITAERRITHPAVALLTKHAQRLVFNLAATVAIEPCANPVTHRALKPSRSLHHSCAQKSKPMPRSSVASRSRRSNTNPVRSAMTRSKSKSSIAGFVTPTCRCWTMSGGSPPTR